MKIEKTTTTNYDITGAGVIVRVRFDGSGNFKSLSTPGIFATDKQLDVLRQALQFIDGETHKHRTAQETA